MIRFLTGLLAMLISASAGAAELKIATWNLNWLTTRGPEADLPSDVVPRVGADWVALRRYAALLDADVVAFEEVDGPEAGRLVFPPDRYALFFTHDQVVQRVGFAVRRGIAVRQNPDLVALDVQPEAKYRLRSGADITLELPGARLRLLAVHLKSGCHRASLYSHGRVCSTLLRQIPPLQGWIAQRRDEGAPFLILGDLNRELDGRDDMMAALNAASPLVRATEGQGSPCWGGTSFIDHIIAGGAARNWLEPNSLKVLVYRESDPEQKEHLSDHCPVSVKLRIPG